MPLRLAARRVSAARPARCSRAQALLDDARRRSRGAAILLPSSTARPRDERAEQYSPAANSGARDFDKVIFNLPIPRFDAEEAASRARRGCGAGREVAAAVELPEGVKFQRARGLSAPRSPRRACRKRSTASWQADRGLIFVTAIDRD